MSQMRKNPLNNNPNRDESRKEKTVNTLTRRVTLGSLIVLNLALGALLTTICSMTASAGEPPAATVQQQKVSCLPFTISVVPDELKDVPDYMGKNNPDSRMDYPFCAVAIDGDYWIIFRNQNSPRVFRYKGTNIEDARRQPDGDASQPAMKGAYLLGGMWYDETEKRLYAPLHHEHLRAAKQVALATSTDKGLTWKYEGLILATYDPKDTSSKPTGNEGDFYLHVDKQHGYFYLYCLHYESQMRHCVARCAITDRMAPGKWTKFYNGGWTEPALGGNSSHVNAYYVMYNTFLKKYISFNLGGSLSFCSDLEKQDWSPSFKIADAWCPSRKLFGYHVTDETKRDVYTGGRTLFVWNYYENRWGGRCRIEFGEGETPNTKGYHPYGGGLGDCYGVSMSPSMWYPLKSDPRSSDPVMARRTRTVLATNAETRYSEGWTNAVNDKSGASIELSFKGGDIYWRAWHGPDLGKADVYVDGRLEEIVDCYANPAMGLQFAFVKTGLDATREHTIKIVVRGEKNPLSTGAAIKHVAFEYSGESYRTSH